MPRTNAVRRRLKQGDANLSDALQQFVRVLETVDERARHAAICWLADKYLGVNLYDRARGADLSTLFRDERGS